MKIKRPSIQPKPSSTRKPIRPKRQEATTPRSKVRTPAARRGPSPVEARATQQQKRATAFQQSGARPSFGGYSMGAGQRLAGQLNAQLASNANNQASPQIAARVEPGQPFSLPFATPTSQTSPTQIGQNVATGVGFGAGLGISQVPTGAGIGISTDGSSTTTTFEVETSSIEQDLSAGTPVRGTISGGPFANAEASITVGHDANAQGQFPVEIGLTAEAGFGVGLSDTVGGVTLGGGAETGQREEISYSLNLTTEQLQDIRTGDAPLPNPAEPHSLPPGSSITASSEQFQSQSFAAAWEGIGLESKIESREGLAFGIERLADNPDIVRVTTGPEESVSQSLSLGASIGVGDIEFGASLDSGRAVSDTRTQSVDIDISTPAGLAAYQDFLATGELPSDSSPAVSNAQSIETLSFSQNLGVELSLGPIDLGAELWEANSQFVTQTGPNGTTHTLSAETRAGQQVVINYEENPDGSFSPLEGSVTVHNETGALRPFLSDAGLPHHATQIQIEVTPQGAAAIQEAAADALREHYITFQPHDNVDYTTLPADEPLRDLLDPNATPQETFDAFQEISRTTGAQLANPVTLAILQAESPEEVINQLGTNAFLDQDSYTLGEAFSSFLDVDPDLFSTPGVSVEASLPAPRWNLGAPIPK